VHLRRPSGQGPLIANHVECPAPALLIAEAFDMVRTSLTTSLRAGVDLDVVQKLLGHASLASTTVYLDARDEDRRRAVEVVAAGERWR
ncbi:MAG: tyrosine-type recombinase/integrase, partial [Nocardioidaceae bacterium]